MQYVFANYPNGKYTLRIGGDWLLVNDGVADIDELNPALVALAEVYGGKRTTTDKQAEFRGSRKPANMRHTHFQG